MTDQQLIDQYRAAHDDGHENVESSVSPDESLEYSHAVARDYFYNNERQD